MTQDLIHRAALPQGTQLDYVLLDGSSSMQSKWWDTIAAICQYTDTLKSQNIASHGILQVFDSRDLDSTQRDGPIGDWGDLSDVGAHWGMTPLYDAINVMARKLKDLDPAKCCIVIVTDGEENGSQTTADQARAMLDWCRAKGWQITFLGADFNNCQQARLLGADDSNSIGVRKQKLIEAGASLGKKRIAHALYGDDISFNEDERKNFGGYLTDGTNGK